MTLYALRMDDDMRPLATSDLDAFRARAVPEMIGSHASLLRVFRTIQSVTNTDCPVLVTGESGTGKELVARALHRGGARRERPFITLNCAAMPDSLIESELFGHARGAFTGAMTAKVGKFMAADGGTIFLDEIGELPLTMQAKLLRVLQEKEVTPVGENKPLRIDVRVVAATNRDLEAMVAQGTFREDLLYRLNVIPVELPALRQRATDIPELVVTLLKRANQKWEREITGISADALDALCHFNWPGNIRQLENVIQRMVLLRGVGEIDLEDLPAVIRAAETPAEQTGVRPRESFFPAEGVDLRTAVEEFENALILKALSRTRWNKNKAAAILHMNRTTLVEKLKKKGLESPYACDAD